MQVFLIQAFPPDATIFQEGDEGKSQYIVMSGELEISKEGEDQVKIVLSAANKRFEILKSLNSNSRELELSNFLGLVLGCIEASKAAHAGILLNFDQIFSGFS